MLHRMKSKILRSRIAKCLHTFVNVENICQTSNLTQACTEKRDVCKRIHTVPQRGPWNVLFFGTDDFAVESLRSLYNIYKLKTLQRLEVVTTNKGRENPIMRFAQQHGITVNTWPLQGGLANFHIGLVVSFGYLIPKRIIHSFPLGMLNVHGSLLPRWRGAAPVFYTLMNGDEQTGVTIMKIMPEKFDIGDIVMQEAISIRPDEMLPDLYARLAKLGADTLVKTLDQIPDILLTAKPQSRENVTYAPKITKKIASVRWNEMTSNDIYNLHRALFGLYPLRAKFQEKKIKLLNVEKLENPSEEIRAKHGPPGVAVFSGRRKVLIVKCKGETWIMVKNLIIEGHRPMTACEFNNGYIANQKKTEIFFCTE